MQYLVADLIKMNISGQVLALCEKYYHDDVTMLSNGEIFAQSMREAYKKQKGFVNSIQTFDIQLVSQQINGNISELVFIYKMISLDNKTNEFTGKHIQTWQNEKIIREEFFTL